MSATTPLSPALAASIATAQGQVSQARQAVAAARINLQNIISSMKTYDFAFQPPHPDDWIPYRTGELTEEQLHEVQMWLWDMAQHRWTCVTHYTPALSLLIYFENIRDAVGFRIAWAGDI